MLKFTNAKPVHKIEVIKSHDQFLVQITLKPPTLFAAVSGLGIKALGWKTYNA
jgi:hypothetical protein